MVGVVTTGMADTMAEVVTTGMGEVEEDTEEGTTKNGVRRVLRWQRAMPDIIRELKNKR